MAQFTDGNSNPRDRINDLRRVEGNNVCAECGEENPEWASVNLGVFLCIKCAGVHRILSVSRSRVRSVRLDTWTDDMVKTMAEKGNKIAKKKWEAKVPPCWVPPHPESRHVCREQWIRAKYERQEFTPDAEDVRRPYTTGIRQGFLFKRKKQCDDWNSRWFVLSHDYLTYFRAYQDRQPKGVMPLQYLNVTLNGPGLNDHTNSMLLICRSETDGKTRNIFVHAENGKEIMDWYCAIRQAKISLLQETYPDCPLKTIQEKATQEFTLTGFLCKTPPSKTKFQKRFFALDRNSLRYYSDPKDPHPLGEIIIGSSADGYWVDESVPEKLQTYTNTFMLHVPNRVGGGFPLLAEDATDKKVWMQKLQAVIEECKGSPEFFPEPSIYEEDVSIMDSTSFDGEANGSLPAGFSTKI